MYIVRDEATRRNICRENTREDAERVVKEFEKEDRILGIFTEHTYIIVEEED